MEDRIFERCEGGAPGVPTRVPTWVARGDHLMPRDTKVQTNSSSLFLSFSHAHISVAKAFTLALARGIDAKIVGPTSCLTSPPSPELVLCATCHLFRAFRAQKDKSCVVSFPSLSISEGKKKLLLWRVLSVWFCEGPTRIKMGLILRF